MTNREFFELKALVHWDWMLRRRANVQDRAARLAERQVSQCQGKHPFTTWGQANETIRRDKHGEMVAYKCNSCPAYHVGGRPRKPNQMRER